MAFTPTIKLLKGEIIIAVKSLLYKTRGPDEAPLNIGVKKTITVECTKEISRMKMNQ